jgi:4-amino-4-deoxy-L-arabinose transferase-like glycosyltransferase
MPALFWIDALSVNERSRLLFMWTDWASAPALPRRDLGWPAIALLAVFATLMFLPGFFSWPPVDRDEARFAQASRQMVESGDYVDIRFQGEARYKKPIGIYWLQAASVKVWQALTGETRTDVIWVYRLPSLVSAVLGVVLTALIGATLFEARTGLVAGVLMACSMLLNVEARFATTDATLLACILTAQLMLARAYRSAPAQPVGLGAWLAGWGALGLGMLIKGPIIVLVFAGTLLALRFLKEDLAWFKTLRPVSGTILAGAIVLPWLIAIIWKSQGGFIQGSVGEDLMTKVWQGNAPGSAVPGFHVLVFWVAFWPGSLFAVLSMPWVWSHRAERPFRFLLAWIVPTWVVFELAMTKLPHYALPAYPAIAVLAAAWVVNAGWYDGHRWMRKPVLAGWTAVSVAMLAAAMALPNYVEGRSFPAGMALVALGAVVLAAVYFLLRDQRAWAFACLPAGAAAFVAAMAGLIVPNLETILINKRLAAAIPRIEGCTETRLAVAGLYEPSIVFLYSVRTQFETGKTAAEALAADRCLVTAIEDAQQAGFMDRLRDLNRTPQVINRIAGFNYANSRRASMTLYRAGAR